jgi:hypothetical protein
VRTPGLLLTALLLAGCGQTIDRGALPSGGRDPAPPAEQLEPVAVLTPAPVVASAQVADHASVPPPPPVPGAPANADPPAAIEAVPGRVAVVIGIDRYGSAPDLTAAVDDARTMEEALRHVGFEEVRVLLDARATRAAILRSIRWLAASSTRAEPAALFYAGHVRRTAGRADGDGEVLDEAMLAADGELVLDGEVADALRPAQGPLWLSYAACYAAGFDDASGPGRISTYASAEDRLAYESPDLDGSFMVEFMVRRALFGAGLLGVEEMHRYASNQMEGRYRRFRPLLDDRFRGPFLLGQPVEPGPGRPEGLCVEGLLC